VTGTSVDVVSRRESTAGGRLGATTRTVTCAVSHSDGTVGEQIRYSNVSTPVKPPAGV
jgi:hypothetical protein